MPEHDPLSALLSRQIHFVCGKGGVGKSVVSCAMALALKESGKRVLLAQINAADSHQHLLGLPNTQDEIVEMEPGLFTVNTTPEQSLKEYALMVLKFEKLYKAAFENPMMRLFLRFVPSISEITMLGKIWFHAEQMTHEDERRFDHVIIDCPSTGHSIGFLRVSQILSDILRTGPAAAKGRAMQKTFEDPTRSALHIVTLAEEMPTNETIEFAAQVEATKVAPLGALIINKLEEKRLQNSEDDVFGGESAAHQVLQNRFRRERVQEHQVKKLDESLSDLPSIRLPTIRSTRFDRSATKVLAQQLGELL